MGPGARPMLAVCTMNESVQELGASLALPHLTLVLFHFRKEIRHELTSVETLLIHGLTYLNEALEKVRRPRTTCGCWHRVDYHWGHLTPLSLSFLHFLVGE